MTALIALGLKPGLVIAQTRPVPTSAEIRRNIENTRREMEQKRREFERKSGVKHTPLPRTSLDLKLPPTLDYRFTPGRQFAYLVHMEWESAGKTHRILGRPFYHVRYQKRSKSATLVLGHFRHFVKGQEEEEFRALPQKDYWMPSVEVLSERGVAGFGQAGKGMLHLPFLMGKFVDVPSVVMPTLPRGFGAEGGEGPCVIMQSANGVTLWEDFTSDDPQNTGRVTRLIDVRPLGNSLAHVDVKRGFVVQATGFSAMYVSQGTFDLSEGLLQKSQGVYELKDNGQTTRVSVSVRRLSGSEFELARKDALETMSELPKGVMPLALARKPIDLFLPGHYSVAEPPRPNKVAGYYDKSMDQYFEVIVLEQSASDKVKIRFQGSEEIQTVRPTDLVKTSGGTP